VNETQVERTSPSAAAPPSQPNPPDRILVVEDDTSIRNLNVAVLTQSGYTVDSAPDGAAAWQALHAEDFDLMITDNNMPKLSGVELLKKMRGARLDLPVIMATGVLPREEFARAPGLQPTATLLKPYTLADLLHLVKKVLASADQPAPALEQSVARTIKEKLLAQAENAPHLSPAPARKPRHCVLVVDADHDLRQMYTEVLAEFDCEVHTAADGEAGWAALRANRYDLLITEHDLPKLSGVELVKTLRAARMALPVVMAAGRLPLDALAQNPELQLADTLTKPFAVETLLATVHHFLPITATSPAPLLTVPGQQLRVG
jgi:DNA-binding response OmpR family regulator